MKYVNAQHVLPKALVQELQKYIQGETLYIPKPKTSHQTWGASTGARERIKERNLAMKRAFEGGTSIEELANTYYLSPETIKKIVYSKR